VGIRVEAADGSLLAAYESPLDIPRVEPPDLTKVRARADGQATAEELFCEAALLDSQSKPWEAREAYERVLQQDPGHVDTHWALGILDLELGHFEAAAVHAREALERDEGHGEVCYLLGVSLLRLGQVEEAKRWGYRAAQSAGTRARGYNLAGRAHMHLGEFDRAVSAFARARHGGGADSRNRNQWLIARYANGERESVLKEAQQLAQRDDPTDFVPRALVSLAQTGKAVAFVDGLEVMAGEQGFTATETALCFAELGCFDEARLVLEAWCRQRPTDAMPHYYLAFYQHLVGHEHDAQATLETAGACPRGHAFPSRVEAEAVLRYAIACRPKDALPHLLLGHLCAALWRTEEAVSAWEQAAAREPLWSEAWRLLGYHAWHQRRDLHQAERYYRQAHAGNPRDQIVLRDLAGLLTELDRREEAIELMEQVRNPRHDVSLWLARAYLAEGRLDECIDFLNSIDIKNPEGSSEPRDIWVSALTKRGKDRFAAEKTELALADFELALTYPANLQVGERYRRTDAEVCFWLGKAHWALGHGKRARAAWEAGASQITTRDPPLPNIRVSAGQSEHVQHCATALAAVDRGEPPPLEP
jgi:tetratricopeptide (TPR) repeat protein